MNRLGTLALLTISLWLAPTVLAQSQRLRFEHLGIEHGLVQGTVFNIMQDRQGFLWIATAGGLHRYDGHTFEVYTSIPYDTTSLSDISVQTVTEAESGDLWVATVGGGLNRFDRATRRFTDYRHDPDDPTSLSSDNTFFTLEAKSGDLWVTTQGGGLNRMRAGQDGRFTRYRHDPDDPTSLTSDRLNRLSEDAEGRIWAGSPNGVNRIDPETETVTRFLYDPASTGGYGTPQNVWVGYFPPQEPGILWLATGNGLVRLHTKTGAHERFLIEPERDGRHNPLNFIREVVPDPSDPHVLWVAGGGTGVTRFDRRTGRFTSYRNDRRDPHSPSVNFVLSLLSDRSGTLWVGYWMEGLSRFNPGAVNLAHLQHDPDDAQSLAPGSAGSIYEDRGGTLWVSTNAVRTTYLTEFETVLDAHLTQFDAATGRVTRYRHDPNDSASLPPGEIRAFAEDAVGQFWVGTRGGLARLNRATGRVTRYLHDRSTLEGRQRNSTLALLPAAADTALLWVGSGGGLIRFDTRTGRFTPVPLEDGTAANYVGTLHEDAEGVLWAGTSEGLVRVDPEGGATLVSAYDARDITTISKGYIQGITEREGEPGILWLATSGGGLDRFDTKSGTARHFMTDDGLPSNVVYGTLEDGAGTLWMGTNGGISNFDPETETFRNYGLDDGLIALEYNGRSYARGAGGELYFGSSLGVTVFTPERLHTNAIPPQVVLTGFRLFNKPVVPGPDAPLKGALSETEEIRLRHDQDHIDFEFVALHYKNPSQNRYAYRLEGFDRDWIDAGADRTATYTNLPPGSYTFRVKAANSDGVWNEEGAAVKLTMLPPWWRTWWAYVLYGWFFIVGVVAVDRMQRRRLREVERRRAAMREAQLRTELAESQTHYLEALDQAKSRFFANISHEFRTPLTLLLGPLQEALDDEKSTERLMQQVPLMHRNAGRLLRLVNQLLDLTKLEAGSMHLHPRQLDIVAFLRELVLAFASYAERDGLTLLFDSEEGALWGSADPDKLEKIVTNLLTNAVKFTMRGGKIRVGLVATDDKASFTLTVSDTGLGIPADELPHVFDRFYQVDSTTTREHEGTGIGLALVKELVELHQGTIAVESKRGFGTTFTVHLPAVPQGEDPGAVRPATDREVPDGPFSTASLEIESLEAVASGHETTTDAARAEATEGTVLVVDDNGDVRAFVCGNLEAHFRVLEAADGEAGLALIRENRPDLVISDVMMPKLDGYALCRAVKSDDALRDIPVILLTARAEERDKIYGLEGGADDYLTKPFTMRELEVRVTNLILSRRQLRNDYSGRLLVPLTDVVIPSGEEAFMTGVMEVMIRHLGDSTFSTDRLADEVSMSRRQVERKVKTLTKHTPPELMQQMRLERASQILKSRPGRIAEVAYAVGFKSPSHFSVAFRKFYGHTPSKHNDNAP